jgi:NitT/TauT family transport system substrate-binding protein
MSILKSARAISLALVGLAVASHVTTAKAADLREVTVAESGGGLSIFAPYLVAIGSGAFEKRGIKISQQAFGGGSAAFAAFMGGSAQFCICAPTHVMAVGAQGRDVVAIFNQFLGGAVLFIAHKKYEAERGTDLTKFDGGIWAYTAEGSSSQLSLAKAAQSAGLDWKKQTGIAVGGVDAFIPTLQSERADIVTMDGLSAVKAMQMGIGYSLFNTVDPDQAEPVWGKQLGLPLITNGDLTRSDPELVQNMVDAMREGLLLVQKYRDDPEKLLSLYPAAFQEQNKETFAAQWELWKKGYNVDGTFTDEQLADTIKFVKDGNLLEKLPENPRNHFVNTWAEKAKENVKEAPM